MEDAYTELEQKFHQLRSVCLKQAALLRQLTNTLQPGPVASGPSGEMASILAQWTQQQSPPCVQLGPEPLPATARINPTGRHDTHDSGRGTFYDLLTEDMNQLGLGGAIKPKQDVMVNHSSPLFQGSPGLNASSASSSASQHPRQADRSARDTALQALRPQACRALLDGDFLFPAGTEPMMSELTLQSHMCDFCQAAFPGHTTTRGEFVRHLHTHIT